MKITLSLFSPKKKIKQINYAKIGIIKINFFKWAFEKGYNGADYMEIDRVDNNLGYSPPDNCRWVTRKENSRNVMSEKIRFGEYKELTDKEVSLIVGCHIATISSVRKFKTWN